MSITPTRLADLTALIEKGKEAAFYHWPEWEAVRDRVMTLDHRECQKCRLRGRHHRGEVVHHVKHLKDRPDLALSIFDPDTKERQLITLCRPCHELEHPERMRPAWKRTAKEVTEERWD